ncbi:MAG: hypothetical protein O3A36_01930 [bacterium]|nr:hypothetical protein [bacterium]
MEHQPNVRALLELSGYTDTTVESRMLDIVKHSPDPETALRHILKGISIESEVLLHKWRKHIFQTWSLTHAKAPKQLNIPLTSKEVAFSPVLVEVHTLIQELRESSADIHEDTKSHFLQTSEEARIARELPLFGQDPLHVRRVCALLEELQLVRPHKGKVRVVESRYREFTALSLPSQYYLLWHVDMYHLDWEGYFHEWGSHLVLFQQYLPMVWEMLSQIQSGEEVSVDALTARIVQSFRFMWQQELLVGLYEQSVLQGMVEMWLIDKICARYGFITGESERMFTWTRVATVMVGLERTAKLPCSTDVL